MFYNGNQEEQELAVPEQLASSHSSPRTPVTRTVAIIKHHALEHRFDIERQIQDAGFEVSGYVCCTKRCGLTEGNL